MRESMKICGVGIQDFLLFGTETKILLLYILNHC